jgi:hypothetical protein
VDGYDILAKEQLKQWPRGRKRQCLRTLNGPEHLVFQGQGGLGLEKKVRQKVEIFSEEWQEKDEMSFKHSHFKLCTPYKIFCHELRVWQNSAFGGAVA